MKPRTAFAWRTGDDCHFVARLNHTTALASPNQFDEGVGRCIDVANARFSPDAVYQFRVPDGARNGCRSTARLDARNFVGGIVMRDACPASEELSCKFENNFSPRVLFIEELEPGEYTLWVKGSGALQSGEFVLELQCTPPSGGAWNSCDSPVRFDLDPLLDRQGFQLGHEKQALVGQNIGATDAGDYGADCRSAPCDPELEDDCGGEIWYQFNQPVQPGVWLAELAADYPATLSLLRGRCGELEEVACGNTGRAIELFDLPAGDYFLVVDAEGANAQGGHQIDITSVGHALHPPDNDACQGERGDPRNRAQAIEWAFGRRVQLDGTTFGANNDRNPQSCADPDADAPEVVFVYTADEAHSLEARVFAGFDHTLYVRGADCVNGPEVICAVGDIEATNLPAGTYYIFVDGASGEQQGGFTLQVTFDSVGQDCRQADGGSCASAQEIVFDPGGFATFLGNNSGCSNNDSPPDGCGQPGEEGVDTVYFFDLPAASLLDIIVDAPFDEVAYLRRADDAVGSALAADLECADNDPSRITPAEPLPAGRYYLIVDAEFADARVAGPIEIFIRADGLAIFGGDTTAARRNYDVRQHDPNDPSTCGRAGENGAAREARDVAYFFTVEERSALAVQLNGTDGFHGVLSIRIGDPWGGCGAPFGVDYLIRVSGVPDALATPYQLTVRVDDLCFDDAFEGPLGNDRIATATPLASGVTPDLVLCNRIDEPADVDIYQLDLPRGANVRVIVEWDEADGRIRGELVRGEGDPIDGDVNVGKTTDVDSIRWDVAEWEGGPLFLQLSAARQTHAEFLYHLDVLTECSRLQREELCADAPDLPWDPGLVDPANGPPQFLEVTLRGDTCGDPELGNCFVGSCDPAGDPYSAREKIWRVDTTALPFIDGNFYEVHVSLRPESDFAATVSFRTGCADDSGELGCRRDPRRPYREVLPPGLHNIVVDGVEEDCGMFELDLTFRPLGDREINPCDSCVSFRPEGAELRGACNLGDAHRPALARAGWENVGGDAGDDYDFVAQLSDTTASSLSNPFEEGVGACMDVANARFSPDTVYEFTTPQGALQGCRFTARLTTRNFVGGLALRSQCPAQEELACEFHDDFVPTLLSVEELEPGTYTIWVKGSDRLESGEFVLELQCTPPGSPPPGDICGAAVHFDLEPLLDQEGFELGHMKRALIGDNIGASDQGDYGAACRAEGCDPEEVACGNAGQAIDLENLIAGDYVLVVDAEGDVHGGHRIDITAIERALPQPPNDACQGEYENPAIQAQEIDFEIGHRVQIDGSTFSANHDRNPQWCGDRDADAPDVVYVYTADVDHRMEARVFAGFDHVLYVRRADCLDGPESLCAEGDLEFADLPPGTYYLFVDGASPAQRGGFTLQITFTDAS